MPITSDLGGKNYTLGRGRLFFDRFSAAQISAGITASTMGEGERFFGNVPSIAMTSSEEVLDHFSSTGGIRTKDDSVTLQLDRTGTFTTDNIDIANLALLFLADSVGSVTQGALTASTYTITAAKRGRFYQIGATSVLPTGVRKVSNVTVHKGAGFSTLVAASGNYEIDEDLGRIYVLPGATDIPDSTDISVTYDAASGTREQVISRSQAIYGALHWVSDNPKGTQRDALMPYVKLSPDGDYNLVGDDWAQMSFTFEILQKGNLGGVYIDGRQA